MALRIQRPSVEENWLYQDRGENDRYFTKVVYLGKNAEDWPECTDAEKVAWEEEHNPQPEQPEEEQSWRV